MVEYAWPEALRPTRLTFYLQHNTTRFVSPTGTATIPIAPPLREALLVNQPLVLTRPSVPMRLVSDDEAANPTRPGGFTAITIRLEEAL
ncbi:MAG: hypothetical protein ING95_16020 [Roseomonas sp.]|nr:hypothetical protein [Roseomonas sp.]